MNMIKLLVVLTLVFLVGVFAGALGTRMYLRHHLETVQAQKPGSAEKIERIVKKISDDLKLDAAQQDYVRKIVTETNARAEAIKVLYEPELKRIYDQSFGQINERLTETQKHKLRLRQEKFSDRFNASYFKSLQIAEGALPDPTVMKDRLGLSDAQLSQVTSFLDTQKKRRASIIDTYQKMDKADLIAMNKELTESRSELLQDLSRVLTKEQYAKFEKEMP
ncbi:MAG: hypothetical protein ABFD12_11935 [Syntrophorhabdus sp.]